MYWFLEALFSKYATFSGRAIRKEFWYFMLYYISLVAIITAASRLAIANDANFVSLIALIISILLVIPYLAVVVRRLHDLNMSGWWSLLMLIPIVLFIVLAFKGTAGENKYGPDPLPKNATGNNTKSTILFFSNTITLIMMSIAIGWSDRALEEGMESLALISIVYIVIGLLFLAITSFLTRNNNYSFDDKMGNDNRQAYNKDKIYEPKKHTQPHQPINVPQTKRITLIPNGLNPNIILEQNIKKTLGRSPDNSIVVNNEYISKHHLTVLFDGAYVYIEDLNSTNGSYFDGEKLTPGKSMRFPDGKRLLVGSRDVIYTLGPIS